MQTLGKKKTNSEKDIKAVTTPVAAPIAKDPLNIPRKIPMDLNIAVTSNVWLLSPAGWYATIELQGGKAQKQNCLVWRERHFTVLHEPCKVLQLLQTLSLRSQGDTRHCNPPGSQRAGAAQPPFPGEVGISHPTQAWMCSYSWTSESRGPKPVPPVTWGIYGGIYGGIWGVWHQLSVMPGAVGPQSIQAGNLHFSTEAADVNIPWRAVTAPILPH